MCLHYKSHKIIQQHKRLCLYLSVKSGLQCRHIETIAITFPRASVTAHKQHETTEQLCHLLLVASIKTQGILSQVFDKHKRMELAAATTREFAEKKERTLMFLLGNFMFVWKDQMSVHCSHSLTVKCRIYKFAKPCKLA